MLDIFYKWSIALLHDSQRFVSHAINVQFGRARKGDSTSINDHISMVKVVKEMVVVQIIL